LAAVVLLKVIQRELKASYIVNLATLCWKFASSVELLSRAATALQEILDQPQPSRTELDQVIDSAVSLEKLIGTSNIALRNPDVVDECLANNMGLLATFTSQTVHIGLSRQFASMKTHDDVMEALRRQLAHPGGGQEAWRVLEYSGMLIV
jgi:hypothetical protein